MMNMIGDIDNLHRHSISRSGNGPNNLNLLWLRLYILLSHHTWCSLYKIHKINFYPFVTNGLSHPSTLDEPTSFLGVSGVFFFHFSMKFM